MNTLRAFFRRAPWWSGPIGIATTFVLFRWLVPAVLGYLGSDAEGPINFTDMFGNICHIGAPFVAGVVGFVWIIALIDKLIANDRLDRQRGIDTIRDLDWREFEQLLATAFERQGYRVTDTGLTQGRAAPDGGIDLILERDGQRILVQCKQWKARRVGVKIVRELYGLVASEQADRGILITSGGYTQPTHDFAKKLPLDLIDGPKLQALIQSAQQTQTPPRPRKETRNPSRRPRPIASKARDTSSAVKSATPTCPKCQSPMLQRTAKRGPNAGQPFWGCSAFPKCRGTRAM